MQLAHKARAKRLAEEGRLLPEDATVDEDGVQLGGKRAAILYAHRLREAAAPVVDTDDFNEKLERFADEAAKAEGETGRGPCSNAREYDSRTVVQPCIWFKDEPSQFSMGQTPHSLTCSVMEKPHRRLDGCLRILLACFRARSSALVPPSS